MTLKVRELRKFGLPVTGKDFLRVRPWFIGFYSSVFITFWLFKRVG